MGHNPTNRRYTNVKDRLLDVDGSGQPELNSPLPLPGRRFPAGLGPISVSAKSADAHLFQAGVIEGLIGRDGLRSVVKSLGRQEEGVCAFFAAP